MQGNTIKEFGEEGNTNENWVSTEYTEGDSDLEGEDSTDDRSSFGATTEEENATANDGGGEDDRGEDDVGEEDGEESIASFYSEFEEEIEWERKSCEGEATVVSVKTSDGEWVEMYMDEDGNTFIPGM